MSFETWFLIGEYLWWGDDPNHPDPEVKVKYLMADLSRLTPAHRKTIVDALNATDDDAEIEAMTNAAIRSHYATEPPV